MMERVQGTRKLRTRFIVIIIILKGVEDALIVKLCDGDGVDGIGAANFPWPAVRVSARAAQSSWASARSHRPSRRRWLRFFLFYIFSKLKFQKYMSVLKNFKNIPRSPYGGRRGSNVNFFSSNLQRSPWRKKRGGLSPPQRATGPCRPPQGRQTPVARWGGDRLPPPYFKPWPKNSEKKRGVRRRKAAKLCRISHL